MYKYQRFRDIREDNEITQKDIAAILNIHQQQYARYETGIVEIPLHYAIKLALYYNISLDYLVGLSKYPTPLNKNR